MQIDTQNISQQHHPTIDNSNSNNIKDFSKAKKLIIKIKENKSARSKFIAKIISEKVI